MTACSMWGLSYLCALDATEMASWVSAIGTLLAIAFAVVMWRLDRAREKRTRAEEQREIALRRQHTMIWQAHSLLPSMGGLEDQLMKILRLVREGSKGPPGKAALAEWRLDFRDIREVAGDCAAFEPSLARKIMFLVSQCGAFNLVVEQSAKSSFAGENTFELPFELQRMVETTFATTVEVTQALKKLVWDYTFALHSKQASMPARNERGSRLPETP